MQNSKIVALLKSFSNKEIRKGRLFLESPYFNKRTDLLDLYDYLVRYHPKYAHKGMESESIFKHFFPKEKEFKEAMLRHLVSDLTLLIEQFLVQQALGDDKSTQQFFLLKSYDDRRLDKYFKNIFKKHQTKQEKKKTRNINYYHHQYLLENKQAEFEFDRKNYNNIDYLIQTGYHLDVFYFADKLRNACLLSNLTNIMAVDYEAILDPIILDYIEKSSFLEIPIIHIHYLIYKMLTDVDNDQHFQNITKYLDLYKDFFNQEEMQIFYIYARNYCIRKINNQDVSYNQKLLDLYKVMIDEKVLLNEEYLSQWDYINIVTMCMRLQDFEYAQTFIYKYKDQIQKSDQDNAFHYAAAIHHFHQQKYAETLNHLNEVNFQHSNYYLIGKTLLMKTHYERNEMITLFSLFDAFKSFLYNNKHVSQLKRDKYKNLVKYTTKLARLKLSSKVSIDKIKEEINGIETIAELDWLKEKIVEFEKK